MKKIIKFIFGTSNNIFLKVHLSIFISSVLFLVFSIMIIDSNKSASNIFQFLSAGLFSMWLILTQGSKNVEEIVKEIFRLMCCFIILFLSFRFCITSAVNYKGYKLLIYSILSCIGIVCCSFYLISKFVDILIFFKKVFQQIKEKLFNSTQPATSKAKALIENITAFLVSIAGLGVAIKTIIEPLIKIFNQLAQ